MWQKDWKENDKNSGINHENYANFTIQRESWVSKSLESVVKKKMQSIIQTYIVKDASRQINICDLTIERTMKRVKLLSVYGPTIFDEACIDPILTMTKDILPRFKVSNTVNRMVMRVASSEPPPPATDLKVPPPMNLLLALCSSDAFPDSRNFTLDEVIGTEHLYNVFSTYLQDNNRHVENLHCIRKIDIFEELMKMNCEKEATDEAWQIYRYFVAQGAAFFVPLPSLDRKSLMLSMAVPVKQMFVLVRNAAYGILKSDFTQFTYTSEYKDFPKLMRDLKIVREDPKGRVMSFISVSVESPHPTQSGRTKKGSITSLIHSSSEGPIKRRILSCVHLV